MTVKEKEVCWILRGFTPLQCKVLEHAHGKNNFDLCM